MKGHHAPGRGRGILESGFDGRGPGAMGGRMGRGWMAAMLALLLMVIVTLSMTLSKRLVRSKIEALEDLLDEGQDRLDECHAELEESRNQTMAEQKRTQACDEVAAGLRLKLSDARSERDKERKEATDNQVSNQGEVRALKSANKKLESEFEECSAKLERDATSSTSRIAKLTKALNDKKEQLERYHETIVKQKAEIEEKTEAIAGLSDELNAARKEGQRTKVQTHQPAQASTKSEG